MKRFKRTKKTESHTSSAKPRLLSKNTLSVPKKPKLLGLIGAGLVVAIVGTYLLVTSFAASSDSISILPATSTQGYGNNFTVTIRENSGTDAVNAAQADFTYDQTKLQFVSIDTATSAFDLSGPSSGGSGTVSISRAKSGTTLTGDQIIAVVTFKAIGTGTSTLAINTTTSAVITPATSLNVLGVYNNATVTVNDTTAPTAPTGLTTGTRTVNSISFSWTASTDNVGVSKYKVYRNGTAINSSVATTSFTDTGLTPNTSYTYTVSALDAANNESSQSSSLVVSTLPDTTAPSIPGGLTAGTRTVTSIAISWTASTDNVAVSGYNIFRNGTKVGTSNTTSYTDNGLSPNTSYSYTVSAYDAANNVSAGSSALATSTLADTNAPSVPSGITAPTKTVNSITLNWTASTDNVGVTGYNIFRNGTKVGTSATNSYTDTGLTQNTSYSYTISAYDSSNNTSAASSAASFSTLTKPGDINSDGAINIFDLSILATNYGQSGKTLSQGDLNNDGTVNIFDLSILATYWGT